MQTKNQLLMTVGVVVALAGQAWGSAETMRDITTGFAKALDECKKELGITENVMKDFYHYWKEDYELLNRDMGCAIKCMSGKLNMLDTNGKLHHGNTAEFAKTHGADEDMAAKLVEIIHSCEKAFDSVEDECSRVLEVAKCFRTKIHELKWAPDVTIIIQEVLTEI